VLTVCLPLLLACSQEDPDGVVHEVMSSWDKEAAAKTKAAGLESDAEASEREEDTPQVDRRHWGSASSGSGTEAPLRLDMSTDFFANVSDCLGWALPPPFVPGRELAQRCAVSEASAHSLTHSLTPRFSLMCERSPSKESTCTTFYPAQGDHRVSATG
jgi:hypothetical protein